MRMFFRWKNFTAIAVTALALASPALAQFSYSSDFNSVASGQKPPGWNTLQNVGNPNLDPRVLDGDPSGWQFGSALGAPGVQNYGVAWSGGKRLSLIHAGQDAGGRSAAAWYKGQGEAGYPMNLQTGKMKASFDLAIRTGTASCTHPADGGVFAILPVRNLDQDAASIGAGGGGMAWGGLGGMAIEFDIWDNGGANDPACPDCDNHIGLDVYLKWAGGDQVPSLVTNVTLGLPLPVKMWLVGDNNQPLHFTVYYNDDAEDGNAGGFTPGIVRVYLKIDPASKDAGDPAVPSGQAPFSFGMDTGHADGALILEGCVGEWPTAGAIFGFTGSTGGCNSVYQVDNVAVNTEAKGEGTPCVPEGLPPFDRGVPVTLDVGAKAGACENLTQPGWDVNTFGRGDCTNSQAAVESNVAIAHAFNTWIAAVTGEPSIAYVDTECGLPVAGRRFPGLPGGANDCYGMFAKGWICFPVAGDYTLNVVTDDGYQLMIGAGTTNQVIMTFDGGRGCGAGEKVNLTVAEAGVYPIQILFYEGGGGSGISFTRIIPPDSLLEAARHLPVGVEQPDVADQPVVFGLYNGQEAPDRLNSYPCPTVDPGPVVALDSGGAKQQNCNGLTEPGWNVRMYPATFGFGTNQTKASISFWDSIGNILGEATEPNINFNDSGCGGLIPGDRFFPGLAGGNRDNIAMLAKGWVCFPNAGAYIMHLDSDDGFEIIIGTGATNQVVQAFDGGRGCGGGNRWTLEVAQAGVYPIQVLWYEGGGGAGIEFYTIIPPDQNCEGGQATLIGGSEDPNQPKVFVLLNGQEAPDLIADYGSLVPAPLAIDPGQKVAGTPDGDPGFVVKTVRREYNTGSMYLGLGAQGNPAGRGFLMSYPDFRGAPSVEPVINFRDVRTDGSTQPDGSIGGGVNFPGLNNNEDRNDFGILARGYAVFETAGNYALQADADDDVYVKLGNQTIYSAPCCRNSLFVVNISEPGVYPIQVEFLEGGGDARVELGQFVPGVGTVAVNSAQSTIKVYTSVSSGPFDWEPSGRVYPVDPARKVADVGQGTDTGWNATYVKAPAVLDGQITRTGFGQALFEDDIAGVSISSVFNNPRLTHTPDALNYTDNDPGTGVARASGRFGGNVSVNASFDPTGAIIPHNAEVEDFVIMAKGYIEFTEPGYYSFNLNGDDGGMLWIAGQLVVSFPHPTGPADFPPGVVEISEPGIYDIVATVFERGGGYSFEMWQYVQVGVDATIRLVNDPQATVKVYRNLAAAPASTVWANPVRLPPSAKAGVKEGAPGMRVVVANAAFVSGDTAGSVGRETAYAMFEAERMLDELTGVRTPLNYRGVLASDSIFPTINFPDAGGAGGTFPGANEDNIAARVTGLLKLTKGGHLFDLQSDDGVSFYIGGEDPRVDGYQVARGRELQGASIPDTVFYVYAEEEGLYRFELNFFEWGGGESLVFNEVLVDIDPGTGAVTISEELVNADNGRSARAFQISTCGMVFADLDGDGDTDQEDFGVFQVCYTGSGAPPGAVSGVCLCVDRNADGSVDSTDLAEFVNCVAGPAIPWSQELTPNCNP